MCILFTEICTPYLQYNWSQRVIAEPESKSIAKCPLGYCVCTNKTKYGGYCVITSGHFNGVFNLHATEDISGIDFWWWTKEIVCSLPLSMIKRLARWINRVSTWYFFSSSTRLTRQIYLLRCVYTQSYSDCVNIQEPQARWFSLSRWRPPGFKGTGYICQTCKSLLITKQRHKNKMADSVCKQFSTVTSWYWWENWTFLSSEIF